MPTYNPLNLLGDYRLANRREAEGITPEWQAAKERQKAWGVPFLTVAGKAGELPYLVGTAIFSLYKYDKEIEAIDTNTELGFAVTGTVVVIKALSSLAKSAPVTDSHMVRSPKEEKLARKLNNENGDNTYGEEEIKRLSRSLEILHAYNSAFSEANKHDRPARFLEAGAKIVKKAVKLVNDDFMSQIETEEEKTWVDRFIKKPINQLIPNSVKKYFKEVEEKRKLTEWIQNSHKDFKNSEYQKHLDKEYQNSSGSYNQFKKDIEKLIKESYQEILANSIKVKTVNLINDFFKMQIESKGEKDILKKEFNKNFREQFEEIGNLHKNSGNEKYHILSQFAKTIIKKVDSDRSIYLKDWKNESDDDNRKKLITKWIDRKAFENDKQRILNLENEDDPIKFIFNKKLDAIIEDKITQSNKNTSEAGFSEVNFDVSIDIPKQTNQSIKNSNKIKQSSK